MLSTLNHQETLGEGGNMLVVAMAEEPGIVALEYKDRASVMRDLSTPVVPPTFAVESRLSGPAPLSECEGPPSVKPEEKQDLEHSTASLCTCFPQWFLDSALLALQALSELRPMQLWQAFLPDVHVACCHR